MKYEIEIDDSLIPPGHRPVRYGAAQASDLVMVRQHGDSVKVMKGNQVIPDGHWMILEEFWVEPEFPKHYGKKAQFSDGGEIWADGVLVGRREGKPAEWGREDGGYFRRCRVLGEPNHEPPSPEDDATSRVEGKPFSWVEGSAFSWPENLPASIPSGTWLARDRDGVWYLHKEEPEQRAGYWASSKNDWAPLRSTTLDLLGVELPDVPWEESKVMKPHEAKNENNN